MIIRQFEEMLLSIKTTGEYNGISYNYPEPAHFPLVRKHLQWVRLTF